MFRNKQNQQLKILSRRIIQVLYLEANELFFDFKNFYFQFNINLKINFALYF